MRALALQLISADPLAELDSARRLFETVERLAPGWMPERCGSFEPLRERFAWERLPELWDGADFMWEAGGGRRAAAEGHVIKGDARDPLSSLTLPGCEARRRGSDAGGRAGED